MKRAADSSCLREQDSERHKRLAEGLEVPTFLSSVVDKPDPTFLGVPLEIREMIYKHRIACDGSDDKKNGTMRHMEYSPRYAMGVQWGTRKGTSPYNLLLTNHQVHEEEQQLFWQNFWFCLDATLPAAAWLGKLSTHQLQQIRRLIAKFHPETSRLRDEVDPIDGDPEVRDDMLRIRSALPNLKSILFQAEEYSSVPELFCSYMPILISHLRIFRDVEDMALSYAEPPPLIESDEDEEPLELCEESPMPGWVWCVPKTHKGGASPCKHALLEASPMFMHFDSFDDFVHNLDMSYQYFDFSST